jgi:hypothetical protein
MIRSTLFIQGVKFEMFCLWNGRGYLHGLSKVDHLSSGTWLKLQSSVRSGFGRGFFGILEVT